MAIKLTVNCDICGDSIKVGEDGDAILLTARELTDTDRPDDIVIGNFKFPIVCPSCTAQLIDKVKKLMISKPEKVQDDVILREECFQVFKNTDYNSSGIIRAIKHLRERTNLGLKESKDVCEYWRNHYKWDSN